MMYSKIGTCVKFGVFGVVMFLVQGCETLPDSVTGLLNPGDTETAQSCSTPTATIVIADFENRTSYRARDANSGLSVKLGEQLIKTGCFTVADRARMQEILEEQGLGQSGLTRKLTVARVGQLTGADLLVFGSITQYTDSRPSDRDSRIEETVRIESNITLTGVESGNVLISETVNGSAIKVRSSNPLVDILQTQSTSDKAIDDMLDKAVEAIVSGMPSQYRGRSVSTPKPKDPNALLAQRVMKEVGTYDGAVDGDIGPQSIAGIEAFQSQFDLPVSGELDEATLDLMRSLSQ